MPSVRTRYAPSPTGDLHLGSLRTVIYDYLFAKQRGGSFLLRVEDTDQARSVEGAVKRQLEALRWMGLEPDEGVCLDEKGAVTEKGPYGPYTQSERLPIYRSHLDTLLESGAAYRCFCTPERLAEMREQQEKNRQPPRYDRRCRGISREESAKRAAAGEAYIVRQAMPENEEITLTDLVRGELTFNSKDLDDHVLLKSDGFPTYQLANVIDDHLMEITHVLRGEEWISSLPKNVLLYRSFGWTPPAYAHLPLILGPDGKHKLSKRDGASTVDEFCQQGYLPEALLNMLAFVGWSPGTEEEFFSKDRLVERFSLERVQKAAAVFNFERLDFVNGWYIRQLSPLAVKEKMRPYLLDAGLIGEKGAVEDIRYPDGDFESYFDTVAAVVQERIKRFDQSAELSRFFFERPAVSPELLQLIVPKKGTLERTLETLRQVEAVLQKEKKPWREEDIQARLFSFVSQEGYTNTEVLWPVRAALTGLPASPGAFEMLALLGKEESLIRLQELTNIT